MTIEEQQLQENLKLITEWCLQYTDDAINEKVVPIIRELINDKAFTTLLKEWKKEKDHLVRLRASSINDYLENKLNFSKVTEKLPLKTYHNDCYSYNDALYQIVSKWNKED